MNATFDPFYYNYAHAYGWGHGYNHPYAWNRVGGYKKSGGRNAELQKSPNS